MTGKILVVGSLNMDMRMKVKHMPVAGETVLGRELTYAVGGKGANQAGAAARLGGNTAMLGCIGADAFGKRQLEELRACGVEVSGIGVCEEKPTGMAVIYVDEEGDNSIVVLQGANACCDPAYIKKQERYLKDCDYVLLQMEIPESTITCVVKKAKELGKVVILNPAPAPERLPAELLEQIDYVTPNETELCALTGCGKTDMEAIAQGAEKLLLQGVKKVLVTLGDAGVLLATKEQQTIYPARKVQAVDTTAAGDCFHGAFAVGLAEGMAESEAIQFANAAASIAVTREGALPSVPDRAEVEAVLQQWKCSR